MDSDKIVELEGPEASRWWRIVSDHTAENPDARNAAVQARVTGSVGASYNEVRVMRIAENECDLRARLEEVGRAFTDAGGVSAFYVPLKSVPIGVEVVQAWRPFLVVERVEKFSQVARMHFVGGHIGGWCGLDSQVAVNVPGAA